MIIKSHVFSENFNVVYRPVTNNMRITSTSASASTSTSTLEQSSTLRASIMNYENLLNINNINFILLIFILIIIIIRKN